MADAQSVRKLEAELTALFVELVAIQQRIRGRLSEHADGKTLKGNELVGWLGEIYGKVLFDGCLVSDDKEHDFIAGDGRRISVKTRKGRASGWKQTSAIPKIDGDDCPTHLLFIHLNDDYSIDRMWLLDWIELFNAGRFKRHNVRGKHRSYVFYIDELREHASLVYGKSD